MMSIGGRRELLGSVAPRYRKATKKEKSRILDEFAAITGYHRKYAVHVLRHPPAQRTSQRRRRKRIYGLPVQTALVRLWRIANCICGKRLVPYLSELIAMLERHRELQLEPQVKALLLRVSPATADRLLHADRQQRRRIGLGTTKPGSLLKKSIPIRTFTDWDDDRPGFVEIDLVAHCGDSTYGQYLYSLVVTDVSTGWTECTALLNRGQQQVCDAIASARRDLPFPLLGIDSDNGFEFINDILLRYCRQHHITFTRSREYKKNDQAHVEQKNWTVVRQTVGHDRYEGAQPLARLAALYRVLRLYVNFCQPQLKLVGKQRVGSKVNKQYDTAKTPYQRVRASQTVPTQDKVRLAAKYLTINPAALLRDIEALQDQLWATATVRSDIEATNCPK
jgi:hypothetical protein